MTALSPSRRYELGFVVSLIIIYITRRLLKEVERINGMVEIAGYNQVPSATIWRNLTSYDHTLNNNVPLIAGGVLILATWFVFHSLAYPRLQKNIVDQQGWLLVGLTVLLLVSCTLVYHYLKTYVRFQHDQAGQIIGLRVFSLYRKRTVLADAIGLGIILIAYELIFQYYQFLNQRTEREVNVRFRLLSYAVLGGILLLASSISLNGYLLPTLWQGTVRDVLIILGLIVQILLLQDYAYRHILPELRAPSSSETVLFTRIGTFLLIVILATLLLWGAATNFYFAPFDDPIMVFIGIVLIGSVVIAFGRQVLDKEKIVLQTQVSVQSAELSSLRAQINPHFLFNALNSLYATALKEQSEKTADGIQKLGDMMRFMLQENNRDRIPLNKEIEYLRNYIDIQRMRIDETHNIDIRVTIQEPVRPIYLAPMLLTPFVENAFKHGISFRQPSWIFITLTLDDTQLYFKVHNSRHAKPHTDPEVDKSGVGLANVCKRLELIYPNRHQLVIQQSEQDYFIALTLVYW